MNDDFDTTQTLGGNTNAQNILSAEITSFFPALESSEEISEEIISKYYDWIFPYHWTVDGGSERRWRSAVRSLCRRHIKLSELENFFAQNSTEGEQRETYSGQDENVNSGSDTDTYGGTDTDTNSGTDTQTFTDNRGQKTTVIYRGVGATPSSANTAETTESAFNANENTTKTDTTRGTKLTKQYGQTIKRERGTSVVMKRGTTRTWTDGRTWTQILNDVWGAQSPLYEFINAFAQILVQPTGCNMLWSPTMEMSVDAHSLPPTQPPTAVVVNYGSATNPKWHIYFGLPRGATGDTGPRGPQGEPGLQGEPGINGVGIPDGGMTGQYLIKKSDSDYDTEWSSSAPPEPPAAPLYRHTIRLKILNNQVRAIVYFSLQNYNANEITTQYDLAKALGIGSPIPRSAEIAVSGRYDEYVSDITRSSWAFAGAVFKLKATQSIGYLFAFTYTNFAQPNNTEQTVTLNTGTAGVSISISDSVVEVLS